MVSLGIDKAYKIKRIIKPFLLIVYNQLQNLKERYWCDQAYVSLFVYFSFFGT